MLGPSVDVGAPARIAGNLIPARVFDDACDMVVRHLAEIAPMGLWAVTRVVDGRQVVLAARGEAYGIGEGAEFPYEAGLCRWMVSGEATRIAPDLSEVRAYAVAAAGVPFAVNAYVGTPIVDPEGRLFGTVCGFDPRPQPGVPTAIGPQLLDLLSSLLSAVLQSDLQATEIARELERAREEADLDVLTGLLNRRGWERHLQREEHRFRRFGDQAGLVVLDLDRLKAVNDTLGHDAGDRHIRRAAAALSATVRRGDVLARLGGDEFGIVAVGATAAQAGRLAERARRALESVGVEASSGHAPFGVATGFRGAWRAADRAMYVQKRARRAAAVEAYPLRPARHRRPDDAT